MDGTADTAAQPGAGEPPALALAGLSREEPDGTVVVEALDLEVARGEFHCLLGRPGSGGSTVLRLVNRLVEPSAGRIVLAGTDVTGTDPVLLRRSLGFAVRRDGLLPHRTVGANLATVPRVLGWKRARVRARAAELLGLVGLDPAAYSDRYPAQLAAEERALVGLARALAGDPPVLLADEPFADLDPTVRPRVWAALRRVCAELGTSVLFSTHDADEALALGDRVAVLSARAHLEQATDPATLLSAPASDVVADLVGPHRGLRRLALTPLRAVDLLRPATVRAGDRPSFASARLASVGAGWGVVVETDGTALGWVGVDDLRAGAARETLGPLARPLPGVASLDDPTLDVLARVLLVPEGWVAVLDGPTYVGIFDRGALPDVRTPLVRD